MRVLIRFGAGGAALAAAVLAASAPAAHAGPTERSAAAAHAAPAVRAAQAGGRAGSGHCYPVNFTWICVYSGSGGGRPGSGGGTVSCTYTKAPAGVLQRAGIGPPAPGYQWDIMTCPGSNPGPLGGQLVQVSTRTRTPAISPFDLFKIAIGELAVPTLPAATAPPRGKDGLVGLPEWYWVPGALWHPVSVTVRAGPVWATASASPTSLSYVPGGGMGSVGCHGPGMPFNRALPAVQQATNCSYTYTQASKGQPGQAFQAGVFVTWTVSWTGSGGAGGLVTDSYTTGNAFAVRVAQAEALVTKP
ncbi:MAG: hypothetical protein LBV34_23040 [Nocardiopsaceae bacterium]|jgi:hypothetical protein|nr:hypothetical protein [Nocardiopsaceae bacterium]